MKLVFTLLSFFVSLSLLGKDLVLVEMKQSSSNLELSGFVRTPKGLHAIADKLKDTWLYSFDFATEAIHLEKSVNLKNLEGFWPYFFGTLLGRDGGRWLKSPWDLEGAASCGDVIYLANEQARHLLRVSEGALKKLDIDFQQAFARYGTPLSDIDINAGFEGVAVDCSKSRLYVAQERNPRALIVVDLKKEVVTDMFQVALDKNTPHPDYADLFFDQTKLYILERNSYRILKLNPLTKSIEASASFKRLNPQFETRELYETGKPYGLAEALYLDENYIYIGIDNNGDPFSEKAGKVFDFKGNNSSVIRFARPEGF